jgi:two-component system response regulator HydG
MNSKTKVLLVDDDASSLGSTQKILEMAGFDVALARDGQEALEVFRSHSFDLVISDVRMPRMTGLEFLRALSFCGGGIPVILMTAFGRVDEAVGAMKLGAVDFLTKPFKRQALLDAVGIALKQARSPSAAQGEEGHPKRGLDRLLGDAPQWKATKTLISQVAKSHASILIQGESGTGKELVARAIHELSVRDQKKWFALNCAALPENLMESELFGFEKGAFTGASSSKMGLFESAHLGTLLLDEVGDMPLSLQAKLLRVLQEGEVTRLGATRPVAVNVRVIAASHHDLRERVKQGLFREDLLYRLEVIKIEVPALRDRLEDLKALVNHFMSSAALRHEKRVDRISAEAHSALELHVWPGNVRELSNVMERAVVLCQTNEIQLEDLPPHLIELVGEESSARGKEALRNRGEISVQLGTSLREVEDLLIRKTLEATDGDKNMTAKLLGINSRTIYRRLGEKSSP